MVPDAFVRPLWSRLGFISQQDMERYAEQYPMTNLATTADQAGLVAIEAKLDILEKKIDQLIALQKPL